MSLFGALNTAVSGLAAQSAAFSNISDNVANSQTTGFKAVDTNFIDYLTTSTAALNESGSVQTTPNYTNGVQGTITTSSDPLALAITGQGFFAVSEQNGVDNTGAPTFSTLPYYTRAGDFSQDKDGYLVNSAGEYLQGWSVGATGLVNQSSLAPIQITQTQFNPVATSTVNLSANLPATPAANTPISSQIDVYDSLGNSQTLTLDWAQTVPGTPNDWTVTINSTAGVIGTADVQFGTNGEAAGTIGTLQAATAGPAGSIVIPNATAADGPSAELDLTTNFGSGNQTIALSLGTFGLATGVTQFAGTAYTLRNLSQNGVPPGSFTGLSMTTGGDVVANYNNGESLTVAQVPLITFAAPDTLQRQNGQAFSQTTQSGSAIAQTQNTNGAGSLVTGSVESSNVDIATEFSKLIVAQQAYGANAKLVTTANQMLQTTLDMKQ
jgi:flagellar hook protein FlgE